MAESFAMSDDECERLLRGNVVGRVALSTPDGPHIVPVNYAVVDDAVVVRTSPYSVLGTYGRDAVLAFEVDQFDHENQRGWSVVARGRAEVVTEPADLDHIRADVGAAALGVRRAHAVPAHALERADRTPARHRVVDRAATPPSCARLTT